MPFLPFVVLLAWQAISRSASFALGWATALYFGQIPGRQGRVLSVISLVSAGWVILVAGFALPLLLGAAADAAGIVARNFTVLPLHVAGLAAAIVLAPPAVAGGTVWADFHDERSVERWLTLVPRSYPASASLGASVLLMVLITPYLLVERWRNGRVLIQVPLVMADDADDEEASRTIGDALASVGIDEIETTEAEGIRAWPMRALAFAVHHLLGATVRGEPMRLRAGGLEVFSYATTISIIGPKREAYRARAALERELAFCHAHLTWSDDSRSLESELRAAFRDGETNGKLDEIQDRIDAASLTSEEWNILYRLRLQLEEAASGRSRRPGSRAGARRRRRR